MPKSLVRSTRQDGFRRSGVTWPFAGIEVDNSEITDEMRAEPMLAITPIKQTAAEKKAETE